jgi:hypothetical protein
MVMEKPGKRMLSRKFLNKTTNTALKCEIQIKRKLSMRILIITKKNLLYGILNRIPSLIQTMQKQLQMQKSI